MKQLGSIAGVLLVFVLSAFALVVIYDKGKDQKALRYADVPPETIDWINSFGDGLDDILSLLVLPCKSEVFRPYLSLT